MQTFLTSLLGNVMLFLQIKLGKGVNAMNKEDILKRSREENANGDEREEKIKLRSYSISAKIGAALCMTFVLIEKIAFDRDTTLLWAIYAGMIFCESLLNAIKLKKVSDIILSVATGLCFTVNIVTYLINNIG